MPRVLLFGVALMVILAALLVAVRKPGPALATQVSSAVPEPPPAPPRAGERYPGWTVTRAYSAHHMLIVEVDTDLPNTARTIAAQLVEPLKGRYDEILVYVRRPDDPKDELPARRIQWTPRRGYVETIFN
jgi:hypothetical protein